jgi:hypothetical protein
LCKKEERLTLALIRNDEGDPKIEKIIKTVALIAKYFQSHAAQWSWNAVAWK